MTPISYTFQPKPEQLEHLPEDPAADMTIERNSAEYGAIMRFPTKPSQFPT